MPCAATVGDKGMSLSSVTYRAEVLEEGRRVVRACQDALQKCSIGHWSLWYGDERQLTCGR